MFKNKVPALLIFAASHLLLFLTAFGQAPKKIKTIIVDAGHGGTRDPGATGQYENSLRSKEKDITLAIALKLVAELKKQFPDINVVPTRTTDIYQSPPEKANIANENKGDLFLCIHADSGPLKTGKRQIGTREETRYKITYKKVKKKKVKISTPYTVTVPVYEYFKMPLTRNGTSVWIFAPHKTSDKLKAIMNEMGDFDIETNDVADSTLKPFDINTPEGKTLANIYAKRYQERSDKLATLVNDEVTKTGREALGVNQRQVGIWVLQATNMPAILVETGFINNPEDERYLNSPEGQQELAVAITKAVKVYRDQVEHIAPGVNSNAVVKDDTPTPVAISSRPVKDTKSIQVKNNKLKIDILDDAEIDNDIVSVYFNKALVVDRKALTAKAYSFTVDLVENKVNEIILYADNLGSIAPNTALMVITDGTTRHEIKLSADFKNNASVKFELKK
ncbi:MAG: N-acetylmuramoyl-L-alanine amidase [Chitinophagaceae bacterium]|nr:N-acetylmuramoyl-L-alanine amidase [Chitinophagaceae bacterium]